MKILLVGEYSRLHNTLKKGLQALGHEVTLVSDGDGFKNYPSDYNYGYKWFKHYVLNKPRQLIFKLSGYDIAKLENGYRFNRLLSKLKGYDIVQLINEAPIKTTPALEQKLLQKLLSQNGKTFLLCCGIDHPTVKYMLDGNFRYSLLDPWLKKEAPKEEYTYMMDYLSPASVKLHTFLYKNITGVIASDIDYYIPLAKNPKFIGMVPNPVNLQELNYIKPAIKAKIVVFLGINRAAYHKKGIPFFEKALKIISEKYHSGVEIIVAESVPYTEYIKMYDQAHIVLDQVYAYDQGYNALEAMAKGKVVFTGAEKEFMEYYGLTERVAVNALPSVESIVEELSFLIENPEEIIALSKRARAFVEREHDYITIAGEYLEKWI